MRRHAALLALAALLAAALLSLPLAAQSQAVTAKPAPAAKSTAIARTPDGHPDLQGVYSNATTVPVARPANLGEKEFYTDEADRTASRQPAGGGGRGGRGG